jgi:hypothetical protein
MMNDAATERIKIGLSIDVENRKKQISYSTASPGNVEILVAVEVTNMSWLERLLHRQFDFARVATSRGKREWFEISPDPVLKEIKRVAKTATGKSKIVSIDTRYTPGSTNTVEPNKKGQHTDPENPIVMALMGAGVPIGRIICRDQGAAIVLGELPATEQGACYLLSPSAYLSQRDGEPNIGSALRSVSLYYRLYSNIAVSSARRSVLDALVRADQGYDRLVPLIQNLATRCQFVTVDPDMMIKPQFRDAIRQRSEQISAAQLR